MSVRETTRPDTEAVRTVHYAAIVGIGPEAYSPEQVTAWASGCEDADYTAAVEADTQDHVVATRNGAVVGFGCINWDAPDGYEADVRAEVTAVYVLPSVSRSGVGTEVYGELERRAYDQDVEAVGLSASLPAVPFYEAHGYDRVATREHEFSPHAETGVTGQVVEMKKEL